MHFKLETACIKKYRCDEAADNFLMAQIATSSLTATANLSGYDKSEVIAAATIFLRVYEADPVNQNFKAYNHAIELSNPVVQYIWSA